MSEPSDTKEGTYVLVFIALAVMTIAQIGVSFSSFGNMRLPINMGIAIIQMLLLTFVFMHLNGSDQLTKITAVAGLFFVGLLFLFTLTDYLTRQWVAY